MGYIAETAVKVTADTKGFHAQAQSGIMGSMAKIGAAAAGALGGLAIGKSLFIDPIKQAGEFQRSLNVLQATTHATGGQIKAASALAQKLGNDIHLPAVSASDAADALLLLGKSGFSVSQAMKSVHGTLLLSTAAEVDSATAAKAVTQNINAFGLKAKDTNSIVDQMAGFMNATGTSFDAFSDSLTYAASPARAVGQSFKETSAQLAILSQNGIEGSMAGTGLRHILTGLGQEGSKAGKALQEVGVHTYDAQGKFVGVRGVIEQLNPVLAKMTSSDRIKLFGQAFGQQAANQARIILSQMPGHYDKIVSAIGRQGQAQQLANAQTKGFEGALSALRSSFEGVQLQIGLKVIPVLTIFARYLAENLPVAAAAVGNALDDVAGVIMRIGDFLTQNVGSWHEMAIAIGVGVSAFIALTAAVRIYTGVQAALNIVLAANPIGLVIIAIAALVIGLTLLYQRSQTAAAIMNAAWAGLRTAAVAVFGFITNTVIPQAIAAWQRFGPGVVSALNTAINTIRSVIQGIATVVSTIIGQIKAHWDTIWGLFGPAARAAMQIVKTYVQTELNVIADVIRLFSDLIHGRWGDAWHQLENIVKDVLSGIVSIVGSALRGLVGTAGALAELVGKAIAAGVKSAVNGLEGLAGDMLGKIRGAINEVAGTAFSLARAIGFNIADGAISGIGNLAGRLGSAIAGAVSSAIHIGGIIHKGSGPWQSTIHSVGEPLARGVIEGFEKHVDAQRPRITAAITRMTDAMSTASKKALPGVAKNFQGWVDTLKASFDAQVDAVTKTVEAKFTAAQAKLDRQKAKLTPAEFQIAQQQAAAAVAKVEGDVSAAAAALASLPAKQAAAWSTLLAQQQANMAALRATLQSNVDDALLAGNTFARGMTKAQGDPLAVTLIQAQQSFNAVKGQFDQGLASQEQFITAANALEDAKTAASEDANATTLLDQYNTWQTALAQQAAAGQAITTQQGADQAAQQAQLDANNQETAQAQDTFNQASAARDDFYLQQKAEKERVAKDAEYTKLSDHLKAMHDRTMLHLGNVQHGWDLHYDALKNMATTSGKQIGDNLADALEKSIPTVAGAAAAIANSIAQHLKLRSPAETGPLSDLDTWWTNLTPTLLQGFDGSGLRAALSAAVVPDPSGMAIGGGGAAAYNQGMMNTDRMEALLQQIEKHTAATAEKPADATEVHVAAGAVVTASAYRSRR